MKKSAGGIKAELMKTAEQVIDDLLKWSEEKQGPSLVDIEGKVLELREGFGVKLAEAVVEQQEQGQPGVGVKCAGCQAEMRYKARQPLQVTSWVGELKIERGYYYCTTCKGGFFPLGPTTGLER